MILLGLDDEEKRARVARYVEANGIRRIVVLSPDKFTFALPLEHEVVRYPDIIEYRFYYRLLQEIDAHTLVVVNECLRTQNRHELTYNCIRLFLNQTPHVLVMQFLPLIDTFADFLTLFDWDTRSRWKRDPWRAELLRECSLEVVPFPLELVAVPVATDDKTRAAYVREKEKLFAGIGLGDPHVIPRQLYLLGGRAKLPHVDPASRYVGRNNRFKLPNLTTYREPSYPATPYCVFELCHSFLDFSDFLALSRQARVEVLIADLRVDAWYLARYAAWAERLRAAYAALRGTT